MSPKNQAWVVRSTRRYQWLFDHAATARGTHLSSYRRLVLHLAVLCLRVDRQFWLIGR